MKMTNFTVHGEPQGKARPRAVRQSGIMRVYTPQKTKDYEREIAMAYMTQCNGMFSGAVSVTICAYFRIPKSASRKKVLAMINDEIKPSKKPDADNIAKAVCDALNGIAYKDDSCVVQLNVEKFYAKEPYIRVYISEA
nr:MAG TPA: Endodeoxyribonuclease RusA [Caudoviricetes sp.]